MTAKVLDGKRVAQEIRDEVKEKAAVLAKEGIVPGLAAVLVGEDPASQLYVRRQDQSL